MHAEQEGELNLAIVRTEQAATVIRDRFNAMRSPGGYTNMPTNEELIDDLHALVNHLMVVRSALGRVSRSL